MMPFLKRHPTADTLKSEICLASIPCSQCKGPMRLADRGCRTIRRPSLGGFGLPAGDDCRDHRYRWRHLPDVVSRIEEVGKHWSLSWLGVEAQEMLRIEAGVRLSIASTSPRKPFFWETGR